MKNVTKQTITEAFLSYCSRGTHPRTLFVLGKLVEHLHKFAKESQLTNAEWRLGLDFLMRCADISDHERNEFILLSISSRL